MNPSRIEGFRRAYESPRSGFYRDLYASSGFTPPRDFPSTEDDWLKIPLLTKKDILNVPYQNRLFIEPRMLTSVRNTSGTGSLGVLCMPRGPFVRTAHDNKLTFGSTVVTTYALSPQYDLSIEPRSSIPRTIEVDRTRLSLTARLAKESGADELHGMASVHIALAPYMKELGAHEDIRFILLSGELPTNMQISSLIRAYPHARIQHIYASSDAQGPIAMSPAETPPDHPRAIRSLQHIYIEILDETDHRVVRPGEVGEIVITTLEENAAFPLIRYRSGDSAQLIELTEDSTLFEITGRINEDRIRIDGGEVRTPEIERRIAEMVSMAADFCATVRETDADAPRPQLHIELIMPDDVALPDASSLARPLALSLRVNASKTYQDGVDAGLYAPLTCTAIHERDRAHTSLKHRRLIDARM